MSEYNKIITKNKIKPKLKKETPKKKGINT